MTPRLLVLAAVGLWLRAALRIPGLVLDIRGVHRAGLYGYEQWWLDSEPDAVLVAWFGHPAVAGSPRTGWFLVWLSLVSYTLVTLAYGALGVLLLRGLRGTRAATTALMVVGLVIGGLAGFFNVGEYPMPGQSLPLVGRLFASPHEENWPYLLAAVMLAVLVLVTIRPGLTTTRPRESPPAR
jgi:hypothetical protein